MEDFYAEEEKLGVDLDGDGRIGKPQNAPQKPVATFASTVGDNLPEVDFTQWQKPK